MKRNKKDNCQAKIQIVAVLRHCFMVPPRNDGYISTRKLREPQFPN